MNHRVYKTNVPVEFLWRAEDEPTAARAEADVRVEGPDKRAWTVPTFHDGGRMLGFRFAAPRPGRFIHGEETEAVEAVPDADGNWTPMLRPDLEDWVLCMERKK